jgi:hypothetical protein
MTIKSKKWQIISNKCYEKSKRWHNNNWEINIQDNDAQQDDKKGTVSIK